MKKLLTAATIIGVMAAHAQSPCDMKVDVSPAPTANEPYRVHFKNLTNYTPTGDKAVFYWIYPGEGTSKIQLRTDVYHNYTRPGKYNAIVVMEVMDSVNSLWVLHCIDSAYSIVEVKEVKAEKAAIEGRIYWVDSSYALSRPDTFKVWLIQHDSVQNTLTAVDSTVAVGPNITGLSFYQVPFRFSPKPDNRYLLKAALKDPVANSSSPLPTYHYSSLYWHSATPFINDLSGATVYNIVVNIGTVTNGPGFIGGNISSGAGRGTGTGISNMAVLLQDQNESVIRYISTDDNGNYNFSDLPDGTYYIYPESINFETIPSAAIVIQNGQTKHENINFEQREGKIVPVSKTSSIGDLGSIAALNTYPNPVSGTLYIENIEGNFGNCTLINMLGQEMMKQSLIKGINEINCNSLPTGMYSLIIRGTTQSQTIKIVKR